MDRGPRCRPPPSANGEPLVSDADWASFVALVPRRLRCALDSVDPRAESVIETLLRLAMLRRGIPILELQFWPDPGHRVDFLLPGKLIVEADGDAFHDAVADALRDALLGRLGYRVLHVPYRRIIDDIEGVLDEIEGALHA